MWSQKMYNNTQLVVDCVKLMVVSRNPNISLLNTGSGVLPLEHGRKEVHNQVR